MTPQEAEDRKLAEEIAGAAVDGWNEDETGLTANAMQHATDAVLPLITAAFSRVRKDRDAYKQLWEEDTASLKDERDALQREVERAKGAIKEAKQELDATLLRAEDVMLTRRGIRVISNYLAAFLAPEPQKAKEEPQGLADVTSPTTGDGPSPRSAHPRSPERGPSPPSSTAGTPGNPAPPPPEEPGRPEPSDGYACSKCEGRACHLEGYPENCSCACHPSSGAKPQPERPAYTHYHPKGDPCNDGCGKMPPQPWPERPAEQYAQAVDRALAPDRGEGERAEERKDYAAEIYSYVRKHFDSHTDAGIERDELYWDALAAFLFSIFNGKRLTPQPDSRDALLEEVEKALTWAHGGPMAPDAKAYSWSEVRSLLSRLRARKG